MLIRKYKIKRDFRDKNIQLPIISSLNNLESNDRYGNFIDEQLKDNINPIIDDDTSIYKNMNNVTFNLLPSGNIESYWGYEISDVNFSVGKKSFLLIDVYDHYKSSKRRRIFREYINGINEDMLYEYDTTNIFLYLNIPNNITQNLYFKCSFFNAKEGKFYQLTPAQNIQSEEDLFFLLEFNNNDKTYSIKYNSLLIEYITFYKIIDNIYTDALNNTANIIENKSPNYKEGTQFVVGDNEIGFDN